MGEERLGRSTVESAVQTEPPPPQTRITLSHHLQHHLSSASLVPPPDLLQHHLPPPPPPYPPQPPLPIPFHILPSRRRGSVYREVPKSCCGLLSPAAVSLRWLMLLLLSVGVCCALVGTVLGATRATAPHHLTIALLMIGVGIVLVTVSGVAWRLMSQEGPPCRAMLGLTSTSDLHEANRRFLPRLPPSYGRPHHPYAAMMYPEFQYRAPPPSYQASMQEYRLRLLLLDRHSAASPPPTYRSHPSTLLRGGLGLGRRELCSPPEYSRPPSYRSRRSTEEGGGGRGGNNINKEPITCLGSGGGVTLVQTTPASLLLQGGAPCHHPAASTIVTISGPDTTPIPPSSSSTDHIQILAHL